MLGQVLLLTPPAALRWGLGLPLRSIADEVGSTIPIASASRKVIALGRPATPSGGKAGPDDEIKKEGTEHLSALLFMCTIDSDRSKSFLAGG
jgi:hypothetical protein